MVWAMDSLAWRLLRGLACLLLVALAAHAGDPKAPAKVTLQLHWHHQFQFAGYYAAIHKGYYLEAGLEVNLRPAVAGEESIRTVLGGVAEFGVAGSDLVLHHGPEQRVRVLAAIFQHSPLVLLARKDRGIQSIHDLKGRTIMLEPQSAALRAYLQAEGVHRDVKVLPHTLRVEDLVKGRVDGSSAFSTDEPYALNKAGIEVVTFSPRAGGIDFYGDCLYTSAEVFKRDPAMVQAFRAASLKGWKYAFEHVDEMIALILKEYAPDHDAGQLRFEAQAMAPLVQPSEVELGYTYLGRWQHIASVLASQGMVPADLDLSDFIATQGPRSLPTWVRHAIAASVILTLMSVGVALVFFAMNRKLNRQILERESAESRFRALFDLAPLPVLVVNAENSRVVHANQAAKRFYGFDVGAHASGFRAASFYEDPKDRQTFLDLMRSQGAVEGYEVRVRTREGQPKRVMMFGRHLDLGGQACMLSAHLDITELHATRQVLHETMLLQAAILDNTALGIALLKDRVFTWANRRMAEIAKLPMEELIGSSTRRFYLDDASHEALGRRVEPALLRGESVSVELRLRQGDGSPIWCGANGRLLDVEHPDQGVVWMFEDISQRVSMEESLRQSEETLDRIFQLSPDPISLTRISDGVFIQVNEAMLQQSGYAREEVIGRSVLDLGLWMDLDSRNALVTEILDKREVSNRESRMRSKDGHLRSVLISARLLQVRKDLCMLTITRDITERHRMEQALRQVLKAESLNLMAGGIAHDFNNHFQVLQGNLEILGSMPLPDPRGGKAVQEALEVLGRASGLSRKLLDFTGRGFRMSTAVEVGACVREALARLEELGLDPGRVRPEVSESLPRVEGDTDQLVQVLLALLANALEAMGERSVPVHLRVGHGVGADMSSLSGTWIHPFAQPSFVAFEVQDQGPGMDPDTLVCAFDPFFSTKAQGRGLGLSAALGIVKAHGGGLLVRSEPGQGCCFQVFLPVHGQVPAPAREVEPERESEPITGKVVLLVDDERAVRQVIAMALTTLMGLEVLEAKDGVEAVSVYRAHAPRIGLVIMDATMPRMGGVEAFEAIRTEHPQARAILSSGFSEAMGRQSAQEHGFMGFLAKPYSWDQLRNLLREAELLP